MFFSVKPTSLLDSNVVIIFHLALTIHLGDVMYVILSTCYSLQMLTIVKQPPETLKELAAFCGENDLHFISDEIYALSVFSNPAVPTPTEFTSVLSLYLTGIINPAYMHVLYGASKDFCANGLRMGFVCTKNEGILGSMSSIG